MKYRCPIETTLSLISGKWKILILKELIKEPVRYGLLNRKISGISAKVLTQELWIYVNKVDTFFELLN